MTHPVDADELLTRIRGARNWASDEADRLLARSETLRGDGQETEAQGAAVEARALRSIRNVLDEVLHPGSHSDGDRT